MTYNKEEDILNMYKYKCGYQKTEKDRPCPVKFMDKPSLILHLWIIHKMKVRDVSIPKSDIRAVREIYLSRYGKAIT